MNNDQKLNFNFEIQEPKQKNNIVVFFLKSKENTNYDLLSFPYAIKNNLVEIDEVSRKRIIGSLKLNNKADKKLLILGSEILIGNKLKQDRVVDETVIIPENIYYN